MTTQQTISGVMVCLYGKGILLRGPSGIGKSECALKLLDRGHQLLSDDAVTIEKSDNQIIASAPELLSGRINVRELGIIHVEQHFGVQALCKKHRVDLIIELVSEKSKQSLNVLPLEYATQTLLGIEIPCVQLTPSPQRDIALLIEMATQQAIQRDRGFNINQAFITQANEKIGQPS